LLIFVIVKQLPQWQND